MKSNSFLQSFGLGSLPIDLRREILTVFTPPRISLLVEDQTPDGQTIPFKREGL